MCFYYSCKSFKLQLRLFLTPFWSLFWMQSEIFKGAKRWFLKVKKKCQQQSTNHSIIHASQGLKKKNLTQVFSVASFLYSPFIFFKVLRKFHCVVIFIKKSSEIFFSLWGKKLPCELILNFFLGLYLNSGTGLSLIFLVKVLMMVILCLSIYSHWFYPKEMEIIGIFTCTHFDAHAF